MLTPAERGKSSRYRQHATLSVRATLPVSLPGHHGCNRQLVAGPYQRSLNRSGERVMTFDRSLSGSSASAHGRQAGFAVGHGAARAIRIETPRSAAATSSGTLFPFNNSRHRAQLSVRPLDCGRPAERRETGAKEPRPCPIQRCLSTPPTPRRHGLSSNATAA